MVVNTLLSAATLAVALTRPSPLATATYTASQHAEAQAHLCDRYRLAVAAVHIETNGPDVALARISATNGAVMLRTAAADPALSVKYRDAALALARSYEDLTAVGTTGGGPDNSEIQKVISDADAEDNALKELCSE